MPPNTQVAPSLAVKRQRTNETVVTHLVNAYQSILIFRHFMFLEILKDFCSRGCYYPKYIRRYQDCRYKERRLQFILDYTSQGYRFPDRKRIRKRMASHLCRLRCGDCWGIHSRSRDPCGGRRRPSLCTARQAVWHTPGSSCRRPTPD